jgi:putative transposase
MQDSSCDTDVTDAQWRLIEPLLRARKPMGRPPTPLRSLLNAIFYLVKSGCSWRLLPKSFPPWKTVCHRFRKWCQDGTWLLVNHALRSLVRTEDGRLDRYRTDQNHAPEARLICHGLSFQTVS